MIREVVAPTAEPLTLTEVRLHLRHLADGESLVLAPPDDSWVTAKIKAARQWAEDFLGYPLTDAVYVQSQDAFDAVVLPFGTTEVVSVQYLDAAHDLQTLDPAGYFFDEFSPQVYSTGTWPTTSDRANAVRVKFRGLYGAASPVPNVSVPEHVKHALLLMIGHWYENREATILGQAATEMPMGVESLLRPQRMRLGMA